MRLDRLLNGHRSFSLNTQSSHGTTFDKSPPRHVSADHLLENSLGASALFSSVGDLIRREVSEPPLCHSSNHESASPLTSLERRELRLLRAENAQLRSRIQQLEVELAHQQKDFEAQRDLNPFGGLSQLRASRVTIGKLIGKGSFGVVYTGQWRGVKCAVKFINDQMIEELRQESSIMDSIDHPNIVRLYGVAVKDDEFVPEESWPKGCKPPCLIMEYMVYQDHNGKSVDFIEYLENSKKDRHNPEHWIQLCAMLQGVARGLSYLHAHNVMVSRPNSTQIWIETSLVLLDILQLTCYIAP